MERQFFCVPATWLSESKSGLSPWVGEGRRQPGSPPQPMQNQYFQDDNLGPPHLHIPSSKPQPQLTTDRYSEVFSPIQLSTNNLDVKNPDSSKAKKIHLITRKILDAIVAIHILQRVWDAPRGDVAIAIYYRRNDRDKGDMIGQYVERQIWTTAGNTKTTTKDS